MMYTYVRQTKLTNICGRSDYITNKTGKHSQEDILCTGGPVDNWKPYSEYEQSHKKTNKINNEGRELIVALPNIWGKLPKKLLMSYTQKLSESLIGKSTDYQFAVHWNKEHTNLHVHIIFSERHMVQDTHRDSNIWDRDIYLTADGKIARKKADRATDEQGNFLPPIHRKGDLKDDTINFTPKDTKYKSKKWLYDAKVIVSKMWDNPLIPDKKHNVNYLHTIHEGKAPNSANTAKEWNDTIRKINAFIPSLEKEGYKFNYKTLKKQLTDIFYCRKCPPSLYDDSYTRSKIISLATNYDKMRVKEQKRAEKEKQQEIYMREVAIYFVKQSIDNQIPADIIQHLNCGTYEIDVARTLDAVKTDKIAEYDRVIKKMHMDMNTAKSILGSARLTAAISKTIELYKHADDCMWSGSYISDKNLDYISRPYAKKLDSVIEYYNQYCDTAMPTYQSIAVSIISKNQRDLEKQQKRQEEYQKQLEKKRQEWQKQKSNIKAPARTNQKTRDTGAR